MRKLYQSSLRKLRAKSVPEPHNSVRILLQESFAGSSSLPAKLNKFKARLRLRENHYPIQYLCNKWPFRELDLYLKPPILIPRFESEYMVGLILSEVRTKLSKQHKSGIKFIEYGCGSGALGLSLHKQLGIGGTMVDIQQKCVDISILNALGNSCHLQQLSIQRQDLMETLSWISDYDIVVSNPPYLSEQHYQRYLNRQVKRYEAKNALVADQNGMKYVRAIANYWRQHGKQGSILALEFDGRKLEDQDAWMEEYVMRDQYEKRRFILIDKC